jgi:hypothetical protein
MVTVIGIWAMVMITILVAVALALIVKVWRDLW